MVTNRVFVLDTNKRPLSPCHPARARELLRQGKAAVWRRQPFTIILKYAVDGPVTPVQVKLDPGARMTGIAVTMVRHGIPEVVWAAELEHRGQAIKKSLDQRRGARHSRRSRKTRYRQPRFDNRVRKPVDGLSVWLAPSLRHRGLTVFSWVRRLQRWSFVGFISIEHVRFDTQLMERPDISGVEYQQGTLHGYEVREYLLEKWGRRCAYCGKEDVPLQIEHIVPRSKGGTDRVSNLTLACEACNRKKGDKSVEEFLKGKPDLLRRIQAQARTPLKDAAAVNSVRWALWQSLRDLGLHIETGSGGRTKYNRAQQGYPKRHWIDAACAGQSGERVRLDPAMQVLRIRCMGRGTRQACLMDKHGFPRTKARGPRTIHGFRTGDLVEAIVPKGKNKGRHTGRVAVRSTGSFRIGNVDGINYKYCRLLQHADGYEYLSERRKSDTVLKGTGSPYINIGVTVA